MQKSLLFVLLMRLASYIGFVFCVLKCEILFGII